MSKEIVRGVGLACWASYLVNGDASGITEQDRFDADAFVAWLGGPVVDVEDDSHFGRPDAGSKLAGDCVTYVALIDDYTDQEFLAQLVSIEAADDDVECIEAACLPVEEDAFAWGQPARTWVN